MMTKKDAIYQLEQIHKGMQEALDACDKAVDGIGTSRYGYTAGRLKESTRQSMLRLKIIIQAMGKN